MFINYVTLNIQYNLDKDVNIMDILLDIFSSVGYIFLGIIGLILLYFSLKYIVFITIDLFCIIVSFPFYLLMHPIRLITNPIKIFKYLLGRGPMLGEKFWDEELKESTQKYRERDAENWSKLTPKEKAEAKAFSKAMMEWDEEVEKENRAYELAYGKDIWGNKVK